MISVETFSPKVKSMDSSFMKNIYIFVIFYHFLQFERSKAKYEKGKISVPRELNVKQG